MLGDDKGKNQILTQERLALLKQGNDGMTSHDPKMNKLDAERFSNLCKFSRGPSSISKLSEN